MQAARRFLQIETQMNESLAALSGHTAGLLRLGLPQRRADELLPQVLAEFQSAYPEVRVQTVSPPCAELERMLLAQAPITPLFFQADRLVMVSGIQGLVFDPFIPSVDVTFATKK